MRFKTYVMLAVCLWFSPAAQAVPSYSSSDVAITSAGKDKAPAGQALPSYNSSGTSGSPAAGEAEGEGDPGYDMLLPDVERTATLRRGKVPRIFYYAGQKDERVTIEVAAVEFTPEVFLKDPSGDAVLIEAEFDGERVLKASATLTGPGRYTVGVRSMNTSNGLFNITLRSRP